MNTRTTRRILRERKGEALNKKTSSTKIRHARRPAKKFRQPVTTAAILDRPSGELHDQPFRIPRRWVRQYRQLVALRERIESERANHAEAVRQPLERFSMDMADAATDEFDRNLVLSKLSAEQNVLYEIDEALKRIETGTYGICEASGKLIPQARLEAMPWTRFASKIEERLERRGDAGLSRLGELRSVTGEATGNLEASELGEEEPESLPSDEALPTSPRRIMPNRTRAKNAPSPSRAMLGGRKQISRRGRRPNRAK